jgi:hypothetical protein
MIENSTILNFSDENDEFDDDTNEIVNDEENYKKNLMDFSISLETRIKIINNFYTSYPDDFFEIVSRISGMYSFSGTKSLEKFMFEIIMNTNLCSFLKIELATSLLGFSELEEEIFEKDDESFKEIKRKSNDDIKKRNFDREKLAYEALNHVCATLDKDLATPFKVETICRLMKNETYKRESLKYFLQIINNQVLDCDYRYKTILSLEKRGLILKDYFIFESCIEFLRHSFNFVMYQILACQNLLQNYKFEGENEKYRSFVEFTLLGFAKDANLDYNLRADAADTLLNLGTEEMKKEGREIIYFLGQVYGSADTVFKNAQNVHVEEIEKSVLEIIKNLSNYPTLKVDNEIVDFEFVRDDIVKCIQDLFIECSKSNCSNGEHRDEENDEDKENKEIKFCSKGCEIMHEKKFKIKLAFNRISMDKALYFNNSLSNILVKVWSYIVKSECREEMQKRLIEELEEMSGTCSSGFASRIVNSITGFGEFNIHISWEDQIVSNFSGRLNAYARKICNDHIFREELWDDVLRIFLNNNKFMSGESFEKRKEKFLLNKNLDLVKSECIEEFYENVLNEMAVKSSKFAERSHFLLFFKTYMPIIYKEMSDEFKDLITISEFDLSFRRAISIYDGEK